MNFVNIGTYNTLNKQIIGIIGPTGHTGQTGPKGDTGPSGNITIRSGVIGPINVVGNYETDITFTEPFVLKPFINLNLEDLSNSDIISSVTSKNITTKGFTVRINTSQYFNKTNICGGGSPLYCSLKIINNKPAIAYRKTTGANLEYAMAIDSNGKINNWETRIIDDTANVGEYTSLNIINGHPAVSYYDLDNTSLKYAYANDTNGLDYGWTIIDVDNAAIVGQYTSLANINGYPAISYYDATNVDLKYAYATDPTGTTGQWIIKTIDSTDFVGQYTSLALIDGRPAISYYDVTNTHVKYAIASESTGITGQWTLITVDDDINVGQFTSLNIIDNKPAISYYDVYNKQLKFAIAQETTGTTGEWMKTIIDNNNVGQYNSLASINGNPAVSYYDASNKSLKYACCTEKTGINGQWIITKVDQSNNTGLGRFTSLQEYNNGPAICYVDQHLNLLKYAYCSSSLAAYNIMWNAIV